MLAIANCALGAAADRLHRRQIATGVLAIHTAVGADISLGQKRRISSRHRTGPCHIRRYADRPVTIELK